MWNEFQEKLSHHLQASGEDDDGGDGAENDGDGDDGMLSMMLISDHRQPFTSSHADVHWGDQDLQWTITEVLQQHHGKVIIIITIITIAIIIVILTTTTLMKRSSI